MRSAALAALGRLGGLSPLHAEFARFLAELDGEATVELTLAAALVSRQVEGGHVCLDLRRVAGRPPPGDLGGPGEIPPLPELAAWRDALAASPVVGTPGDFAPLVLDGAGRLYLYRYWHYEQRLAEALLARAREPLLPVDRAAAARGLARLFPGPPPDGQRVAAAVALLRRLAVVSGGPGTGKTTTVVRILALLAEHPGGRSLRAALAAPTGKAAARLTEAVRRARETLDAPETALAAIPQEASTVHRLLGALPGSSRTRHDAANPLPLDVLVVDEASMVDLPLMAKLVAALPPAARLILLGDRDQLASVEAGAVLGDLCGGDRPAACSAALADALAGLVPDPVPAAAGAAPGLADSVVLLHRNYRFGDEGAIGDLSRAVNRGDAPAALATLREGRPELTWRGLEGGGGALRGLARRLVAGYAAFLRAAGPEEALSAFGRFRVLCALRGGWFGVEEVNALAERELAAEGLLRLPPRGGRWYRGRPVLVTANDHALRLSNGDIGLALPDPAAGGDLRVFFPDPAGGLRALAPARLPTHETVYAMTVHKSQGSEFDEVLLVLGDRPAPVLTRELVYTGVTRARRRVEVWGTEPVFSDAVCRRVERSSGLRDALWGSAGAGAGASSPGVQDPSGD